MTKNQAMKAHAAKVRAKFEKRDKLTLTQRRLAQLRKIDSVHARIVEADRPLFDLMEELSDEARNANSDAQGDEAAKFLRDVLRLRKSLVSVMTGAANLGDKIHAAKVRAAKGGAK